MYLGDTTTIPNKGTKIAPDQWGWLKALIPQINLNVPANVGIDIKAPESVKVDVFSSLKKNLLPITAVGITFAGVVIAIAYAVSRSGKSKASA